MQLKPSDCLSLDRQPHSHTKANLVRAGTKTAGLSALCPGGKPSRACFFTLFSFIPGRRPEDPSIHSEVEGVFRVPVLRAPRPSNQQSASLTASPAPLSSNKYRSTAWQVLLQLRRPCSRALTLPSWRPSTGGVCACFLTLCSVAGRRTSPAAVPWGGSNWSCSPRM